MAIHHRKRQAVQAVPYTSTAFASVTPTTGAVSSLGWPVDFYDDFTGTFTRFRQANWYDDQVLGAGQNNAFRTGALYKGTQAVYPCDTGAHWSGGLYAGTSTLQNVGMASSLLTFNVTNVGGAIHHASVCLFTDTPWGYWEWNVRVSHGADGTRRGDWALWTSGSNWPSQGEFDIIESAVGSAATAGGFNSTIHCGAGGSDTVNWHEAFAANPLPGGGTWDDGTFHTYGAMITPSYLGTYVDGTLTGYGAKNPSTNAFFLKNLSTASDPPFTNTSGSFGYQANSLQGSLTSVSYNFTTVYNIIVGYQVTTSATTAFCPAKMDIDWWRHSKLYPASGGPHV